MGEIFPAFPTPIGAYEIDIDLEFVYDKIKNYSSEPHRLLEQSNSSYGQDNNILHDPELLELRARISECLNHYTDSIGLQSVEITGAWYNEMKIGTKVTLHRHEGSVLSGAFYVRVDENTVPLRLINPLKPYKNNDLYDKFENEYASMGINVKPMSGQLLIFPSWLEHETDSEESVRCVISFNTQYRHFFYPPEE